HGRRYRSRGAFAARLLRARLRAAGSRILQDRAGGPNPKLGAGSPADLPRGDGGMARLRTAPRAAQARARPRPRRLSRRVRDLKATAPRNRLGGRSGTVDFDYPLCRIEGTAPDGDIRND